MNRENVIQLLKMLGAERIVESPEWVRSSCPFAPWTHARGTDTRPSFGVKIAKQSHYFCFSCQRTGLLPVLVTSLCMLRGKDNLAAREFVMDNEDLSIDPYENLATPEPLTVLSPSLLKKFDDVPLDLPIVKKRRIAPATIARFDLRYDSIEKRLIFPIKDTAGNLVGFRGRAVDDNKVKYREYSELCPKKQSLKGHGIWYGINFMPPAANKVFLVEGEMDAIKLAQALHLRAGVLGAMGASLSDEQIGTIQSMKNPVILFLDNDEAGKLATQKLLSKLQGVKPRVFIIREYSGCKDPDEIVEKGRLKIALQSMEMVG